MMDTFEEHYYMELELEEEWEQVLVVVWALEWVEALVVASVRVLDKRWA